MIRAAYISCQSELVSFEEVDNSRVFVASLHQHLLLLLLLYIYI